MSNKRARPMAATAPLEEPGPKVLKDEGLVYTILMSLSLKEVRRLWRLRGTFFKVLKDKVVPLLALSERDWKIVKVFMDSSFQYNLDSVFTEAVLESDFAGLKLLAERKYVFGQPNGDARLSSFIQKALRKGRVEPLSLLRSLRYDLHEDVHQAMAEENVNEQLMSEGSITVDFLGSRNSFRFSLLDLATTSYAEGKVQQLCKHRTCLYKVPFVLSSFFKAGAATNSFIQVDSCGYLLLLALAAESFNFVYLLIQEAVNLPEVLERYSAELLQMVSKALGARPGVLELMHFCGYQLPQQPEEQQHFDSQVLECIQKEDFAAVERLRKLGLDLRGLAERQQQQLGPLLQQGFEELCESAEEGSPGAKAAAVQKLAEIDRRVLEMHFKSDEFLEYAGKLMEHKEFVQMRHLVEVHPYAFRAYFEKNYAAMEELLFDAFCRRQIALIADLTSLHLPIAPFLTHRQVELDGVLQQSWFASKSWTELVMLRCEVKDFDFGAFFRRTAAEIDFAVIGIIKDGYWFDLHKLAQLDFDFDAFFDRRFEEISSAVMKFMAMPHPHFVLLRELSALNFPWDRFMKEHGSCISRSKDEEYLQFLISLGNFEVGSKVHPVVEQTCKLYHSMANTMFNPPQQYQDQIEVEEAARGEVPSAKEDAAQNLKANTMARAKELARLAMAKKVDAKKVMALLICRGMYCWNPLKAYAEDAESEGKDSRVWSQIESVLNFLDAKEEMSSVPLPPPGVPAVPNGVPHVPPQLPGPHNAVWIPQQGQPQVHTLAQLQSLLQYQQIYQGSPWQQQQMVIHIVCLTQRAEEHVFDKKIEFFWHGILDHVLPLEEAAAD